jgi:shikimate kinase
VSSAAAGRPRPSDEPTGRPGWICLAGFMGVGKSRVGRILARRLECPFVDTDRVIERVAGMSIRRIFATRGEATFRRYERVVVERVVRLERAVVAVGGGTIVDAENRRKLRDRGPLVILEASPETIVARTRRRRRPLLAGGDLRARIVSLLEARAAAYADGDLHIATDETTPAVVARAILAALRGAR